MSAGISRTPRAATPSARAGLFSGAVGLALALAACASGGSSAGGSSAAAPGPLEIAAFSPFTGPNAPYGYFQYTGCVAAGRTVPGRTTHTAASVRSRL